MKTYNGKIAELNKEMEANYKEALNCKKCQEPNILLCDFHSRIYERIDDLVKQLNELKAEAIEEVKELLEKDKDFLNNFGVKLTKVNSHEFDRNEAVIDYLKQKWNIKDEDL